MLTFLDSGRTRCQFNDYLADEIGMAAPLTEFLRMAKVNSPLSAIRPIG
jgi:hypothetical protein